MYSCLDGLGCSICSLRFNDTQLEKKKTKEKKKRAKSTAPEQEKSKEREKYKKNEWQKWPKMKD